MLDNPPVLTQLNVYTEFEDLNIVTNICMRHCQAKCMAM